MKRITCIVITIVISLNVIVYAQNTTMTPYEQKREQLVADALEEILNTLSVNDKLLVAVNLKEALEKVDGDRFQEMAIMENLLFKFCDYGDLFQTEANILAQSFDSSDIYSGQSLQSWKEIGDRYKKERLELDKSKTDLDFLREKEREELLKELPGIAGVKQRVRKDYLKWAAKGEYEKTIDYNERIAEKGPAIFDSLCHVQFNNMFNSEMELKLSEYDADREGRSICFFYGEENNKKTYVDAFWYISPKEDKNLDRPRWSACYAIGAFKKNNDIYPATYHFVWDYERYSSKGWDIVLGAPEPIQIAMNEVLKGTSAEEIDHIFDYSAYTINLISRSKLIETIIQLDPNGFFYSRDWNDILSEGKKSKELGISPNTRFFPKDRVDEIKEIVISYYESRRKIDKVLDDWKDIIDSYNYGNYIEYLREDKYEIFSALGSDNTDEISSFLENYIMEKMEELNRGISDRTDYLIEQLKKIKMLSSDYKIDMDLLYSDLISKSESLSHKYRKYSKEEALARFKKNVMNEK